MINIGMPTSSLLNGQQTAYIGSNNAASATFNQTAPTLYINQPRVPFEYYVNIQLNNLTTARSYIQNYFTNNEWQQVTPLIKSVEMPAFKIETTPLNQYNRKRLSQTKIAFEPVKMVFHDVVDGKTLKFWEMYYRYYFADGNEPGINTPKINTQQSSNNAYSIENFLANTPTSYTPNLAGMPTSQISSIKNNFSTGNNLATTTPGNKQDINNILSNTLTNHGFGFNLPTIQNIRNLIQNIQIYQVHAGRFNQVTLVNPRISSFTHDILNYSETAKTLELTFTFEYEYAYYVIQNMELTNSSTGAGGQANNTSSIEPFTTGTFLDLSQFTVSTLNYIESPNPASQGSNLQSNIDNNVQSSLGSITNAYSTYVPQGFSTSSLSGLVNITPPSYNAPFVPNIQTRPFSNNAIPDSTDYQDVNRTGNSTNV